MYTFGSIYQLHLTMNSPLIKLQMAHMPFSSKYIVFLHIFIYKFLINRQKIYLLAQLEMNN